MQPNKSCRIFNSDSSMKKTFILAFALLTLLSCSCHQPVLRLASYNIRGNQERDGINQWQFRKDTLTQIILRKGFKLVGLQEAVPDQLADIISLTGYKWVGADSLYDPIIYDPSRIEVLNWDMFWLNEGNVPGVAGWDGKYDRYCTWGQFKDVESGKEFMVFNTHLDHRGIEARPKGAALICAKADSLKKALYNHKDIPVIIMGDQNSWDNTETYAIYTSHYRDARAISKLVLGPLGTAHNFGGVHPVRIDYFFVNDCVEVQEYNALDIVFGERYDHFPSDHYPIYIDVLFK